jgi:RHS repeat-associated protein
VNQYFTVRNRIIGTKHVYVGTTRVASKMVKADGTYEKDQYFFHPDHLGSSNYVTDAAGALFEHLEYFPSGETWVEESTNTQRTPYLFTAKELDEETDLYFYGARYYDPRTSVWQNPDPLLDEYFPRNGGNKGQNLPGSGGVFLPINLAVYTYSYHNPVKYLDPDGNAPNQAGATSPSVILAKLRQYEWNNLTPAQAMEALWNDHGGNVDRYFYTDTYGWVDVRHFGRAAELGEYTSSSVLTEGLGVVNEVVQWFTEWGDDYRSGFSPEDTPSNAAGARFGEALNTNEKLSTQFEKWLTEVGGREMTDPAAKFSELPTTDPSLRGGANRGSSNASSAGPGAKPDTASYEVAHQMTD